jgi:hypothetical protein
MTESVKQCPDDTGYLQETARITIFNPGDPRFGDVVQVGYGGYDFPSQVRYSPHEERLVERTPSEYAVIVHEDASKAHPDGNHDFLRNVTVGMQSEIIAEFMVGAGVR